MLTQKEIERRMDRRVIALTKKIQRFLGQAIKKMPSENLPLLNFELLSEENKRLVEERLKRSPSDDNKRTAGKGNKSHTKATRNTRTGT